MKRGEIWIANLNPPRGKEIGKIRPVLIVQADELSADITPMVVVLPLSTQIYPDFEKWRITISARDRLRKACQVITDQPRALDRTRLADGPLTALTANEIQRVEKALLAVLGAYQ
ncbi:MAG TPA: type II toxin-antitoxin system PemK/MazF family toxin [Gammaproteobacteria bacterium]|nr:type II toxin-antitoxin system PemK/MazF family toxin [Gammaproteobacteria bacterium]